MSRGPDAGTLLVRALVAGAARAGCPIEVEMAEMVRWASVTFTGARHALRVTVADSPALAGWLAALPEAEFALRGHIVADIAVEQVERADGRAIVTIEALTVEEL